MRRSSRAAVATVVAVSAALILAGCTPQQQVVAGSAVTVAVTDLFTSANPDTSYGRGSQTNADVAQLISTGFGYPDAAGAVVGDGSFGSAQLLSRDPLTVKYTVNSGVDWSDGTPIDASDLLLAWAADSGALNTPEFDDSAYVDAATGRYTKPFPSNVVFFDGAIGAGLERAGRLPIVGDGGRSLTVIFDAFVPDWSTLLVPWVPAHVVAELALHTKAGDAAAGKTAVLDAIQKDRRAALHALAGTWNTAYDLGGTPKDERLLVSSGPYAISSISGTRVVLKANRRYTGDRRASFETVTLRISPDPLETAELLASGEVDVATPQPSKEVAKALAAIPGLTVSTGVEARYEHLDLQFAHGRNSTFADPLLRRAFLDVVPRQQILQQQGSGGGSTGKLLDSFLLLPGSRGYAQAVASNGSARFRSVDVDAAKKLLARARSTRPQVCILYDPSNPRRVSEFQLIRASAARAGFVVTDCSSSDWQGLLGVDGSYDAALFAWDATRLGPAGRAAVFGSGNPLANFSHYSDKRADALISQLDATDDPAQQTALLIKLDTRIWAGAYGVPLYAYPTMTAVDRRVTGVTRSPFAGGVFWNAWAWKPATASPVG